MRIFAMGDLQAPFARVLAVLQHHNALSPQGRLAPDVQLITLGDYFDYGTANLAAVAAEGIATLRWLTSHTAEQCTIILGNHDTVRVVEFAQVPSDAEFQQAARRARELRAITDLADRRHALAEFHNHYPWAPPPNYVARDFAAFTCEQRNLLRELLLHRRFALAVAARLPDGRDALLSHAGVTVRELTLLGLSATTPPTTVAAALQDVLTAAVCACETSWQLQRNQPLSLAPLQIAATAHAESGGLLFHRPANPARSDADPTWEFATQAPRRFAPTSLPRFHQVVGHTTHRKLMQLAGTWPTAATPATAPGKLRTLRVTATTVEYQAALSRPRSGSTDVIFIDGELHSTAPEAYELLPLARLHSNGTSV